MDKNTNKIYFKYDSLGNLVFDNTKDFNELFAPKYFKTLNPKNYIKDCVIISEEVKDNRENKEKLFDDNPEVVKDFFEHNIWKYLHVFHVKIYSIPLGYLCKPRGTDGYLFLSADFEFVYTVRNWNEFQSSNYKFTYNCDYEKDFFNYFDPKIKKLPSVKSLNFIPFNSISMKNLLQNNNNAYTLVNKLKEFFVVKKKKDVETYLRKNLLDKLLEMGCNHTEPMIEFRNRLTTIVT